MLDVYKGSTLDCYTWNDMNEPSVLNGSEVSNKPPMFRQGPGAVIELSEGFVDYANPIATYAADSQIKGDLTPESLDVMVTTSGRPGVVFNGVADWVYEEEVLSDTRAIWFSPDGDKIAWIEFNDTNVDVMTITHYGQPGNLQFQYPIQTPLSYRRPGRKNPTECLRSSCAGYSLSPKTCSAGASIILLHQ